MHHTKTLLLDLGGDAKKDKTGLFALFLPASRPKKKNIFNLTFNLKKRMCVFFTAEERRDAAQAQK